MEDKVNIKLKFRGSSNQRIINVKESLEVLGAVAIDFDITSSGIHLL